jgi:hypothetical protein
MGWIEDVLKEVPLSAVLKERIALADQKYEGAIQQIDDLKKKVATLERENADLRAQIPHHKETSLPEDTARVLVQIFRAKDIEERDVGNMAMSLNMERGVLQYHLDRLLSAGSFDSAGWTVSNVLLAEYALPLFGGSKMARSPLVISAMLVLNACTSNPPLASPPLAQGADPELIANIKAEREPASKVYASCLDRAAKRLDDHKSDPATIARGMLSACGAEFDQDVKAHSHSLDLDGEQKVARRLRETSLD